MAAPTHVNCACQTCTEIRMKIEQIFQVLNLYGWLLNSYVVDFFQEDLWAKLPDSWKSVLEETTPQEFGTWLSGDISCTRVWPLSLLALREVTKNLQINRNHEDPGSSISCLKFKKTILRNDRKNVEIGNEIMTNDLNHRQEKFDKLFTKHIKKKKRYEIKEIAKVCASCAYNCNCKCIVDIGSGMGHLARSLAFQHDLCVTCIEQDNSLLQQASKCDKELLVSLKKHVPNFDGKSPQHVAAKLESSNLVETELINRLQKVFKHEFSLDEADAKFGLVGLHPCGDLAPLLLKLYTSSNEIKFICIVGCCYMKLTLRDGDGLRGYPLSNYLLSLKPPELTYTALEVACHAIEKYSDKLITGNYEDLIVHAYRAALETILIKKRADLRHSQVKNVKVTKGMTFEQYCAAATTHLEKDLRPQNSDLNRATVRNFVQGWQRIIIFGSLRIMLAPLVETVVLFDRFLFLSEKSLSPVVKAIFDAKLSPRNLVLISSKGNHPSL